MPTPNVMYSPSKRASAPWPSGVRLRAPPRWRSSLISSGLPEPGPAAATQASIAASGSSASMRPPPPIPGVGPSGSMWTRDSATGGIIAKVSISGSRSRSGASSAAPAASSPMKAPSITARARPRRNSGMSGSDGICIRRALVVASSGAVRVHAAQALRTSALRSHGQNSMPA